MRKKKKKKWWNCFTSAESVCMCKWGRGNGHLFLLYGGVCADTFRRGRGCGYYSPPPPDGGIFASAELVVVVGLLWGVHGCSAYCFVPFFAGPSCLRTLGVDSTSRRCWVGRPLYGGGGRGGYQWPLSLLIHLIYIILYLYIYIIYCLYYLYSNSLIFFISYFFFIYLFIC